MSFEKLPSGFYARTEGGLIQDAALIEWDGVRGAGSHPYTIDQEYCRYYIDARNNVYYSVIDGGAGIWCSGDSLVTHCAKLARIAARR